MDLNIVINRLLPGAKYRLSKSNPPHEIIEWRDERPQPTQEEIEKAWSDFQLELTATTAEVESFKTRAKKYKVYNSEQEKYTTLYLEEEVIS